MDASAAIVGKGDLKADPANSARQSERILAGRLVQSRWAAKRGKSLRA